MLLHAIGTYVSLGIDKRTELRVLGLNDISIKVSPLKAALALSPSPSESTPRNKNVNGSLKSLSLTKFKSSFFFFSLYS